jgi:hypothetical protein
MWRSAVTASTSAQSTPATAAQGIWRYPPGAAVAAASTVGYAIDATDGFVGTVGAARDEPSGAYLIALGGPWIGGRSLMIPAGAIGRVEREARVIHVACTRAQLRDAPAYENDRYQDVAYRRELASYYQRLAAPARIAGLAATLRGGSALGASPAAFAAPLSG